MVKIVHTGTDNPRFISPAPEFMSELALGGVDTFVLGFTP